MDSAIAKKKGSQYSFVAEHPFEKRQSEANRILASYPSRIPIIVEKSSARSSSPLADLDKRKFLCPGEITVGQFQAVLRKRLKLNADTALFLYVKNVLPPVSAELSHVYQDHKDADGFLYVVYAGESTFGGKEEEM
ncbi:hypothetical protein SmJEL517_g04466 [Synchytrium microbalum]|uniref:Autophagy-related protein n=1 Tax=Synchytrium microbalum TaxID=1806994 RepID=A0A507C003_9FUNG|nr:uncharacterized protein SmJEL517_g04466 [Synchytrium microbalum]TPX32419.1 hypothetical protein SmJEL517_g04466 [Synchytrium microbalum]